MKQTDHKKNFTAQDIHRYHAGELSMQERHALEKAALDDPFLADALEGYQHAATSQTDLADLQHRLAERITPQRKRIYPIFLQKPWMRVAALFLLLAGAGWTVYQFSFSKENDLATNPVVKTEKQETAPASNSPIEIVADSTTIVHTEVKKPSPLKSVPANTPAFGKPAAEPMKIKDQEEPTNVVSVPVAVASAPPTPLASAPADSRLSARDEVARRQTEMTAEKEVAAARNLNRQAQAMNTFRGQILDPGGNPVPNASVTLSGRQNGTTTNLQGQFSLTTPDTVANATIAAVGYESNQVSLRNANEEQKVVLNESSSALNEVVVTGYGVKRKTGNARKSNARVKAEVEELEPVEGWSSFNNYISQNLQIPEEVTSKQLKGEVELSFEVNKDGEPVNIKVEKSLCESCDKEAVRLLKEGPGWKKKKKKSGKVKIRF